jgi:hypothetical protein
MQDFRHCEKAPLRKPKKSYMSDHRHLGWMNEYLKEAKKNNLLLLINTWL